MKKWIAAAVQMDSGYDKELNFEQASLRLAEAAEAGASVIAFPEYFHFGGQDSAEEISPHGATCSFFAAKAKEYGMWIHTGSILEKNPSGKPFNTSMLFAPDGTLAASYRKIHLFDSALPEQKGKKESDKMSPGSEPVSADAGDFGVWGLTTCYDVRFPELYRHLVRSGVQIFFVPSDFVRSTGRAHREILLRARAIENGCYVIAPQQTGTSIAGSPANGETMIIDPWGVVLAKMDDGPGIVTAEIDPDYCEQVRSTLGILNK